jgi:hypothetical protein
LTSWEFSGPHVFLLELLGGISKVRGWHMFTIPSFMIFGD